MVDLEPILRELTARFRFVRSGLDVGFGDEDVTNEFRDKLGGVWMSVNGHSEFPFEDAQFEVVVMDGSAVSREMVRESHRVLRPEGYLVFMVPERTRKQAGYTAPEVYGMIREGFDMLSVRRPPWWTFGSRGHTLTVCARKKAWREHRGVIGDGKLPFTPFRSR